MAHECIECGGDCHCHGDLDDCHTHHTPENCKGCGCEEDGFKEDRPEGEDSDYDEPYEEWHNCADHAEYESANSSDKYCSECGRHVPDFKEY